MDSHIINPADEALVRPDIKESLDAYVHHGRPLGDFLEAVVANLLVDAISHADTYNMTTIAAIAGYVYNRLPYNSWGSRAVYHCWVAWHNALRTCETKASPEVDSAHEALTVAYLEAKARR